MSEHYDGANFFTFKDGIKMATPLLLALAVVEISDVAFAVDSIPAVSIFSLHESTGCPMGYLLL